MSHMGSLELARELHDGLAQELVAMGYGVDRILAIPETPNEVRSHLRALRLDISHSLVDLRTQIYHLRNSPTQSVAQELQALYSSFVSAGRCTCAEVITSIEDHQLLISLAQELLRNAKRHADASEINLDFFQSDTHIILTVGDNGRGGAEIKPGHFGLVGIKEEVAVRGGTLEIRSHQGTVITIAIPL